MQTETEDKREARLLELAAKLGATLFMDSRGGFLITNDAALVRTNPITVERRTFYAVSPNTEGNKNE